MNPYEPSQTESGPSIELAYGFMWGFFCGLVISVVGLSIAVIMFVII